MKRLLALVFICLYLPFSYANEDTGLGIKTHDVEGTVSAFTESVNSVYPVQDQSAEFKQKMEEFSGEFRSYLETYFDAYDKIPDAIGSDVIMDLDEALKAETGFTVYDLNEKTKKLTIKMQEQIIPHIHVYLLKKFELFKKKSSNYKNLDGLDNEDYTEDQKSKGNNGEIYITGKSGREYSLEDINCHDAALDVLGLSEGASQEDINKAYKRLVKENREKGLKRLANFINPNRKNRDQTLKGRLDILKRSVEVLNDPALKLRGLGGTSAEGEVFNNEFFNGQNNNVDVKDANSELFKSRVQTESYVVGKSGKKYWMEDLISIDAARDILHVDKNASEEQRSKSYRKISKNVHSDKVAQYGDEFKSLVAKERIQILNFAKGVADGKDKPLNPSNSASSTDWWKNHVKENPSEADILEKQKTIKDIKGLENRISKIRKGITEQKNLVIKEMEMFSSEAKVLLKDISLNPGGKIESSGNWWNGRLKSYYLYENIVPLYICEMEKQALEKIEIELKASEEVAKKYQEILKDKNLDKEGRAKAKQRVEDIYKRSKLDYGKLTPPGFFKSMAGQAIPLLFAMCMRDVFHTVTLGIFAGDNMSTDYKNLFGATFRGEGGFEKSAKTTFGHYWDPNTYISLGSFMGTSFLINRGFSSSVAMKNLYKFADKHLYRVGGKTLVRAISGFGISMGAGMFVSKMVGTGLMFKDELFNSDERIRELAWDIFNQTNLSTEAFQEITNIIISFGLAEMMLDKRFMSGFYDKLKLLNKKKCAYTYEEILAKAKRQTRELSPKERFWKKAGSFGHLTAVFILADILENFVISNIIFPNASEMMEQKRMKYVLLLAELEFELFKEELLMSDPDKQSVEDVLNKYRGYVMIEPIIDQLSSVVDIPTESGSIDPFVACLKLRTPESNEAAKTCLEILINSMTWADMNFVSYYNSVCAPEDRVRLDAKTMRLISRNIQSKDHKAMIEQYYEDVLNSLPESEMTDANQALAEIMTPELMTQIYLNNEKKFFYGQSMMDNAKKGNVSEAVLSAKETWDLWGMPDFYPLFKDIITDAWDMNLTGPYGFSLDKVMSEEDTRLKSPRSTMYLKKIVYLLSVLYPKMINGDVYVNGIPMTQYDIRAELLENIFEGLFSKLKGSAIGDDLEKAIYALNIARIEILFSTSKEATTNVWFYMDKAFINLGIEKIYIEPSDSGMAYLDAHGSYDALDFDIDEFYRYANEVYGEELDYGYDSHDAAWGFVEAEENYEKDHEEETQVQYLQKQNDEKISGLGSKLGSLLDESKVDETKIDESKIIDDEMPITEDIKEPKKKKRDNRKNNKDNRINKKDNRIDKNHKSPEKKKAKKGK